jgi:hypothetical protein
MEEIPVNAGHKNESGRTGCRKFHICFGDKI